MASKTKQKSRKIACFVSMHYPVWMLEKLNQRFLKDNVFFFWHIWMGQERGGHVPKIVEEPGGTIS
jgi:hypothetical protein